MDAHGRQDRGARPRRAARRPQAHRRVLFHARGALLPDRRAVRPSALTAQHGRLRQVGEDFPGSRRHHRSAPHRAGRGAVPEHEPAGAAGASGPATPPAPVRRRLWCFSTASTSPRNCNTAMAFPNLPRAASAVSSSTGRATAKACAFAICRWSPRPSATPRRFTNIWPAAASSIPNASASWRSRSAAITRRARLHSNSALPAASPGVRCGISTKLGGGVLSCWIPARCRRCRCRRNIWNGCSVCRAAMRR